MTTKRKKNVSYNEIRSLAEDWTFDDRNTFPYSGESVQNFLKKVLNGKGGEFFYDADTTRYLVFADAESRDLYLSNREEYADLIIGTFDAPANYTAEITIQTPAINVVLSGKKGNYVDFTFDIKNRTGSSTGEAVIATFTFNNSGNVKKITQIYSAGTNVHFLADSYLSNGINTISVVITGRNTLVSTMASVSYTLVDLKLTSDFNFSTPVEVGQYLSVPYTLEGAGVKYIEWFIDGEKQQDVDTITELRVNRIKNIDTTLLTVGKHSVQARAYITNNGENFYSGTLYFDFVLSPENEQWESDSTYILLGLSLEAPVVETLSVRATQYEKLSYKVAVYDSRNRSLELLIKDNNIQIQSIIATERQIESLDYTPLEVGAHVLLFTVDGASASVAVTVEKGDVDIEEVTSGLLLKLSAKGRSNSETNPGTWEYNGITTDFNGFKWNEKSGWYNDALVIPAGASIDVGISPLSGNPITNGRTIEIEYETSDIENDDDNVISLIDENTGAGIEVTASTAKMKSSGGAEVSTKYRSGDRVHLTFIINKTTGDNGRLIFIVNNGILERAASYAPTDVFRVENALHIGSNECTVKIRSIRVYDRALSVEESFCNFAVDSDNLINIVSNNDIINEATGMIDVDKVNAKIPIIIITGDMQPIFDATSKDVTVFVDMEYHNMQDPSKDFTATHVRMRPQGTSSLGYPRKNLRPYTAAKYDCVMKDANGEIIEDGLYAFKDNSQPVNCWTLKADYAESSGSHNTGVARIWNNLLYAAQIDGEYKLRTQAQKTALQNGYNYDVRTTVDGFPIVVFHRQTADSELVCLGQYNFNNDKSTEKVFGFTDIPGFDNEHVQCFEFLANESPICLFDDVSEFDTKWDDAFESRYPDTKTPNLVPLKTLATWINSCKNDQNKWNTEKADHFDLYKLAAYYVYLMRFGAVDQTVKNAMITTEDGVHWFFINYDNDTIMGIDNISTVLNAWDYTRQSQRPDGTYYFAGHTSVLWNCFENDQECMSLVRTVDTALYSAGLTYVNLIKIFDEEQCDKWCERLYNDNGNYKYIQPFKEKGAAVLYMLQGNRKSYRHWWLQHRMDMFDAIWAAGAFRNRNVQFKVQQVEGEEGGDFTVTSARDTYYGYGINNVIQEAGVAIQKGQSHTFTIPRRLAIGDPVYIYNANNASKIDISDFALRLLTLDVRQAIGNDGESELKSLVLGDGVTENISFTEISGLPIISGLEELDIRGFKAMTSLELSVLQNLHIFKAAGSGLTSFVPATGATLTEVSLPDVLQSIVLNGTEVTALTYTPTVVLRSVSLRNVTGSWDAKGFVLAWLEILSDNDRLAEAELTLAGIDWIMTSAKAIAMGKIGVKNYRGKITLPSMSESEYHQLVDLYGENAFKPGSSFIIDAPASILLSGPDRLVEGTSNKYNATIFPVSENPALYLLYSGTTLIERQQDSGTGEYFRQYNNVRLWESTGVIETTGTISSSFSLSVRAQISGTTTYSDYITLQIVRYTYPDERSTSVQGVDKITNKGEYQYGIAFSTEFTADIASIQWSIVAPSGEGDNVVSIKSGQSETEDTTLVVGDEFDTAETIKSPVTLQCLIRFYGPDGETIGKEYTVEKNITIKRKSGIDCVYKGNGSSAVRILGYNSNPTTLLNYVKSMEIDGVPIEKTTTYVFNDTKEHEAHIELMDNTEVPKELFRYAGLTSFSLANTFKNIKVYAFANCDALKSLVIPDSVTSIENSAFYKCTILTSIKIGNSVKTIDHYCFDGCSAITSVTIGSGVTYIHKEAFVNSIILEEFIVSPENETYSSADGVLFNKDKTSLILFPYGKSGAYTIPNTVTSIEDYAFSGSKITSVVIPDSVTSIYNYMFYRCSRLTSVTIGNNVTSIGEKAFYQCTSLTGLIIPDSVQSIGKYAFYECTGLTSLEIPDSVTSIDESAFVFCSELTSVTIGSGVTTIAYNAFSYSSKLEEFIVSPYNETYSSTDGFILSKDKTTLIIVPRGKDVYTIPNTVTTIGKNAFNGSNLTSIEIPDSVTTIGEEAFSSCRELTSIVIPDSVTTIGIRAFNYCSALKNVVLPNSLTTIGFSAFTSSGLTSIVIPDSVTSIGSYAFECCSGLTSVTIGSGVTEIGVGAFSSCGYIETITINLQTAPTYGFGEGYQTAGYYKRTTGTNILYVPANATGYDKPGGWINWLLNSSYGGFTLSKTL